MVNQAELEYVMQTFLKTFEEYRDQDITVEIFTDGWAFAVMLRKATHFKMSLNELMENPDKWTFKFNNLKKIINAIEQYFDSEIEKGIKTKDIDLVEIARNNNPIEISKFFEVVIAVLTEAPNKEDHIGVIMNLDQRSQTIFVQIIQNLLETRVVDLNQQGVSTIAYELENENELMRAEVETLLQQNMELQRQNNELKTKVQDLEEQIEKCSGPGESERNINSHEQTKQRQNLRNMISSLQQKIYHTVRDSEERTAEYREQVAELQAKLIKFEQIQGDLEVYKKKYNEAIQSYGKAKSWERQKVKLKRIIDEKDDAIRKLQEKLEETNELNYSMQEKEVYLKMELEKRDVRFKELQKQVRKKFENSAPTTINDGSLLTGSTQGILSQEMSELQHEEMEELREQVQKQKKKMREMQREAKKLRRNLEKMGGLEAEKKKLEKIILDVNRDRVEQINLLVQTVQQLYSRNQQLIGCDTKTD